MPRTPHRVPLDLRGLAGRDELFRLDGARKRDPAVEAWMHEGSAELKVIARHWFERMRRCGDDVREVMHDGQATACVADAAFAYVAVYTQHVNVGFFRGATLDDAGGLLEGSGKAMRHVKLRPGQPIDEAALDALVAAAHVDMQERVRAER